MDFDNARNLKDTILNRVLEHSPLATAATAAGEGARDGQHHDISGEQERWRPEMQIGVGVGAAPRNRGRAGYEVVVFYRGPGLLGLLDRIDRVAGDKTRIRRIAVGRVRSASGSGAKATHRPLRIGCSVSHHMATAGTLGCFIRLHGDQRICLLSNNHVIANVVGRIGDGVLQPGTVDGGGLATHQVAKLHALVPLNFGSSGMNHVDCAAARILTFPEMAAENPLLPTDFALLPKPDRIWLDGTLPPERLRQPMPVPLPSPSAAPQAVWKYGRTTEWTKGVMNAVDVSIRVAMRVGKQPKIARFDGQVAISGLVDHGAFAKPGDSGSVVLLPDGSPVALVFAVTDAGGVNGRGLTFANPFVDVLTRLGATLCL